MSWLWIYEHTPGHLLMKGWVIPVSQVGPGALCQDRLDLAACSTFPPFSCHSLPHHDHQISPCKKDVSLHIFHSDGLLNSSAAGQWNLALKELWGSSKEKGLGDYLWMASLKFNINLVHLIFPIPKKHLCPSLAFTAVLWLCQTAAKQLMLKIFWIIIYNIKGKTSTPCPQQKIKCKLF